MSIGAVSSTREGLCGRTGVAVAVVSPRPMTRRKVVVSVIMSSPFYPARVRESLRSWQRSCAVSQPERCGCRLDRLADGVEEIAADRFERDLVPQPHAEGVDRARRVVSAAVEAPVDGALDPRPQRLHQRERRERRARDRELTAAGDRPKGGLEKENEDPVGPGKCRRKRAVHERALDDDVYLIQAVTEDGDRDRDGQPKQCDVVKCEPRSRPSGREEDPAEDDHERGVSEELELLAPRADGATPPRDDGGTDAEDERDVQHA